MEQCKYLKKNPWLNGMNLALNTFVIMILSVALIYLINALLGSWFSYWCAEWRSSHSVPVTSSNWWILSFGVQREVIRPPKVNWTRRMGRVLFGGDSENRSWHTHPNRLMTKVSIFLASYFFLPRLMALNLMLVSENMLIEAKWYKWNKLYLCMYTLIDVFNKKLWKRRPWIWKRARRKYMERVGGRKGGNDAIIISKN